MQARLEQEKNDDLEEAKEQFEAVKQGYEDAIENLKLEIETSNGYKELSKEEKEGFETQISVALNQL